MLLTKRPKALAFLCVAITYAFMVNINLSRRARAIEEERERRLATDLGGGQCKLTPPSKVVSDENSTKTLLASFPGSGKRFAYEVIEGLTDHAAGDDWNFSGHDNALHVKSSYPHHEGTWTWGDKMDQMILLLRNPRWALPSYHTMRFELDFSESWAQSYARIPYVYTVRPAVAKWETWREENFATEMDNWVNFINFWMDGGTNPDGTTDAHCPADLDCNPKAVLDFDRFYQEHPTTEFYKLGAVLDASPNVDVIAAQARSCVLDAIFDNPLLHNARRNGNGPAQNQKRFTSAQLGVIRSKLQSLITKYSAAEYADNTIASDLVFILVDYDRQVEAELNFELEMEE